MHEGRILVTAATGCIGSRLFRELEAGGRTVRCLARQPARVAAGRANTEVVPGDCLDAASLDAAMRAVDQAFYLVHSMASGARFAALDRDCRQLRARRLQGGRGAADLPEGREGVFAIGGPEVSPTCAIGGIGVRF